MKKLFILTLIFPLIGFAVEPDGPMPAGKNPGIGDANSKVCDASGGGPKGSTDARATPDGTGAPLACQALKVKKGTTQSVLLRDANTSAGSSIVTGATQGAESGTTKVKKGQ